MDVKATKVALRQNTGLDIAPCARTSQCLETTTFHEPQRTRGVRQVLGALGRSVPLNDIDLPDEFFPAHLSVALVNAVCRLRPEHGEQPAAPVERYCLRFGVTPRREHMWELPETDEQETLADLMSHYDELEVEGMANEVFQSHSLFLTTAVARAEHVLNIAQALRGIGVNNLHDVQARHPETIFEALRAVPGADAHCVRMVLMYTGDDDFVLGDEPVRRFVECALGRDTVSAGHAANFVREAAYELGLSPRVLDRGIWASGTNDPPSFR